MKLDAHLGVDVVAHEADDTVDVLLHLEAPTAHTVDRAPSTLQVVLDRSGSMAGRPLDGAKRALVALVERLEPTDNLGLVVFDDTAEVVVPAGPLTDKAGVLDRIRAVRPGGTTDLSAGYVRALREVKRVFAEPWDVLFPDGDDPQATTGRAGATVLIISDGHVNAGLRDVDRFADLARAAYADRVTTTTLGYGEGYDETLLSALARGGSGNHVFAADPDAAGAAIAQEVDGLLEKVALAASLTVRFAPEVAMLRLFNDLPAQQVGDGAVMVELGDLWSGEARKLLLRLHVPAMPALGLAQVASLDLQWVELPGLVEHTVSLPISVNVVPGDEAAQRVPDPTVRSEVLFQEAQEAKRKASEAFERGDLDVGRTYLGETELLLDGAAGLLDGAGKAELDAERADVRRMQQLSTEAPPTHVSKLTRASYHQQNRKRGRRRESDGGQ
ncbi:vWA domain-containing protein [Nocardioides perillae]|uniref:Ca-activated chloride channel family protein n=1 Tax=Nocardioides perillae TaxID=1119534 RepID=A0A7Y9RUS5_9ACTN|nr:VWA domain-containing protein [Nocardioides perillae]NYG54962.1 Ca-activated chloride channel family protein [Nocardioides perillae]